MSKAEIKDGRLILQSLSASGSSRYMPVETRSDHYKISAQVVDHQYDRGKAGLIFGFKDWNNYNFFLFEKGKIAIGDVTHGTEHTRIGGFSAQVYSAPSGVLLEIEFDGPKTIFSINGVHQTTYTGFTNYGNGIGPVVSNKGKISLDHLIIQETKPAEQELKKFMPFGENDWSGSGTGFFIGSKGLIATNQHVVGTDKVIGISVNQGNTTLQYRAKVLISDTEHDLAILKIEDSTFKMPAIPYSLRPGTPISPGASVFSIGYPLVNILGSEAKFTDGKISSKTGYKNSVSTFQTTVAVQPGNSGSPLFNDKGELIGIINAIIKDADNVSYAIKVNHLHLLMELLNEPIAEPVINAVGPLNLEEKVKRISPFIVLIKVK